ncbi:hypothetical protein [Mycolicibacterium goodii]|uniref:Secreted protein n=1 Tax=Mycolicibacterium goodii TaxID=134601 RepID=A0ABS6HYI7_MYCGD|nr:hypothetical protein [Mycolicibacterium goodii]MBU8814329.1 hypothetical protein [Mycolicibacterium goodii]MBU8827732.1 hypothetical protein [Mycolicibacterium goodii]MBU8841394.1 hypothetical protein [Mycolicibacterium goodii]
MAVVLAIALTAVVTVLIVRPDSGTSTAQGNPDATNSEFASAGDDGPVTIITDDPTCDAWNKLLTEYSSVVNGDQWDERDPTIPASSWTPEQRAMYESAGKAMSHVSGQAERLAMNTPHRVMRVLYEQYIAYSRAFIERIPSYLAKDDGFVSASNAAGNSLANICGAIRYRSAHAVAPLVQTVPAPETNVTPQNPVTSTQLLKPGSICEDWDAMVKRSSEETEAWRTIDKNIPASDWTPEQKSINEAAAAAMRANADQIEQLGRKSGDPTVEGIAILGAQYRRAFAISNRTYKSPDSYLALSATNLVRLVSAACEVAS